MRFSTRRVLGICSPLGPLGDPALFEDKMRSLPLFWLFTAQALAAPSALKSFLPKEKIELCIVDNLDLSTFRSSFGPRRGAGQRTFKDLGETAPTISSGTIDFKSDDWSYTIRILGRRDYNGDGLEDIAVCFVDRALKGTYNTSEPLLLTRYAASDRLIALAYQVADKSCPHVAR